MRSVGRLAPPLLLMGVIFVLSATPDLDSGLEHDLTFRKLGHMAVFGTLYLLWLRAGLGDAAAVAVTLLYAAGDEYHQTFTEGRSGSPWDWAIDAAGVGVAALVRVGLARRRLER